MQEPVLYEVVQGGNGWLLRHGRTPVVEFPTEGQAVRAAIAVCRDEGLTRLVIRRAGGGVEELDPWMMSLDVLEV
jgi:FAD/FMN-containing dehydrogenase